MDKEKFQERTEKIKEVDAFVKTLDPSIREAAFKLLESYITGRPKSTIGKNEKGPPSDVQKDTISVDASKEEFFSNFDHDKPADNALLIAAHHYSQYGTAPLTAKEARAVADSVGITIPNRIDVTFGGAKENKRAFFKI